MAKSIQFVVLIPEGYTAGPFKTKEDAQRYVNSDPQKAELRILELVPPAKH